MLSLSGGRLSSGIDARVMHHLVADHDRVRRLDDARAIAVPAGMNEPIAPRVMQRS